MSRSFKYHRLWLLIGVCVLTSIIYLSLTSTPPKMPSGYDKVNHLIAYAVLTGWFGQLYVSKGQLLLCVVSFICLGILLEILQGMSGYRTFDYMDMIANSIGVLIGLWLTRTWFAGFLLAVERKLGVIH